MCLLHKKMMGDKIFNESKHSKVSCRPPVHRVSLLNAIIMMLLKFNDDALLLIKLFASFRI